MFRGRRPAALRFGTSGLRGLVTDITDLEGYVNARGFLEYLHRIDHVAPGDTICIAGDLRPSTDGDERSILRAVVRAVEDAGLRVENLGFLPTPALAYYALRHDRASIMVTGSHIPFDRNGIKFNRRDGEVLKEDEPGILAAVADIRAAEYERAAEDSLFGDDAMFRAGARPGLPPPAGAARVEYLQRYLDFFPADGLRGRRIVLFQHSAVGRDLVADLLRRLGAEVHPVGRSDEFMAIDTEAMSDDRLEEIQAMADAVSRTHGPVDAVVSTDGDSDRPLLVGIDGEGRVRFFGGDLVGLIVADYLGADAIAVPISATDAVDRHFAERGVEIRKTKIGSPYVIAAMREAEAGHRSVVGWEANGGVLTGTEIERAGRRLEALPTRDAVLPILATLFAARERGTSMVELFEALPPRHSKAGLIDEVPQESSRAMMARFMPQDPAIIDIRYGDRNVQLDLDDGTTMSADAGRAAELQRMRVELGLYFGPESGFGDIVRINTIDGMRLFFDNGDVAHIRPSGNAPQLRIYAVADTQRRADEIVRLALREPDGVLRRLQTATGE
jgi:phosphomannomutase